MRTRNCVPASGILLRSITYRRICVMLLAIGLLLALLPSAWAAEYTTDPEEQFVLLTEIISYVQEVSLYAGEFKPPVFTAEQLSADAGLFEKLLNQIFKQLDRYSYYMPADVYESVHPLGQTRGYIGIDCDDTVENKLTIRQVIDGTPAAEAGLEVGDWIVKVNGQSVEGWPFWEAFSMMYGNVGEDLTLTVRRGSPVKTLTVTMARMAASMNHVSGGILEDNPDVGYIQIGVFGSASDFMAFADLCDEMNEAGVRRLIIDLRGNPGGYTDVAANILNYIAQQRDTEMFGFETNQGHQPQFTWGCPPWDLEKVVVLVNPSSASASEIFAASARDIMDAVLVGETTYGKGTAQYMFTLSNGDRLAVTFAHTYTPGEGIFDGRGVAPDIAASNTPIEIAPPEFASLSVSRGLYPRTDSERVLAVEQRLQWLGYFRPEATPDIYFNGYTSWVLNAFQADHGLPALPYASVDCLVLLSKLAAEPQAGYRDDQLGEALKQVRLARRAAYQAAA